MRKRFLLIMFNYLMATIVLSACSFNNVQEQQESSETSELAQITKAYTDLQEDAGWWIVPSDVQKLTVFVEAANVETVLFWVAPTGTEIWGERELVGYDIDGSDGWSLEWVFGERKLHDHIVVQALGNNSSSIADVTINVTSVD